MSHTISSHGHVNHKLVVSALRVVADYLQVPFFDVKSAFIAGDVEVTFLFWECFYSVNPFQTYGVNYCGTCQKFILEFVSPLVPWSLKNDLVYEEVDIH